jgi:hypothetical protein
MNSNGKTAWPSEHTGKASIGQMDYLISECPGDCAIAG